MEFSTKAGSPEKQKCGCLVVGLFEDGKLTESAAALDRAGGGLISELVNRGDMKGKAGSTLMLHHLTGVQAQRVLLVGLGKEEEGGIKDKAFRDALNGAVRAVTATGAEDALFCLSREEVAGRDLGWKLRQAIVLAESALYRSDGMKSKKDDKPPALAKIGFLLKHRAEGEAAADALLQGRAIAAGMNLAKELADVPANVCTPGYLAEQAKKQGKEFKLKVDVLDRSDMEKLGMGALLAVARGSHEPPKFIVMHHHGGKKKDKPVVLVGKGITFDSGGISLKPGEGMEDMKYDMCGAASVFGCMKMAALLDLPLNIVGVIPATENLPGGSAIKPGDIVTSLSGQTIEILNTDAEGRLILCDALSYAERFQPECVVDIATLTGAVVVALGAVASGLMANDEELAQELLARGQEAGDRAWQMPLWDDYQEMLQSNFADMPNIGTKGAGSITAACFLARFTKAYKWAHLDIAGTAWKSGKEKGATGRPVPLLAHFLLKRAGKL
ncbi:MAG: leucyl aminopeptidase [Rhodocyclaceae bacterium]|nr:leucyl aminopeptidase [Rhodocyclaceae bacterium]